MNTKNITKMIASDILFWSSNQTKINVIKKTMFKSSQTQ